MVSDLPFIDEFDVAVAASAPRAFASVTRVVGRSFEGSPGRAFTALLGCEHRGATYTVPPIEGQETNGFRVAKVVAPTSLILEGRHRFASYRLSFFVESTGEERSRVRARTDAAFPGIAGALYRAFVIGSGGHALIARRLLSSVARGAERDQAAGSTS